MVNRIYNNIIFFNFINNNERESTYKTVANIIVFNLVHKRITGNVSEAFIKSIKEMLTKTFQLFFIQS